MTTEEILKQEERLLEENRKLRTAVEELSALNEIATAITSTQSLEQIVDLIVRKCVKHLNVEQGAVMLLDEKDLANPFHTMIRKQDSLTNILPYRFDAQLTGWMLKNKTPLLINDLANDPRFKLVLDKNFPIRTILSVPMMVKGKMIGLLSVFNKKTETGFKISDQRLLGIIAAQSAQVIENARLYQEEQALFHLQEEMKLAYDIQSNLLPKSQPILDGYLISGKSNPARDVGGDYFDFIRIDEHRLAFCLGDISGKGIPAALLMANLQATLRGQTLIGRSCTECVYFANNMMYHNTAPEKFATLFYGVIDNLNHTLTYCNAGHNNPFLLESSGKMRRLQKGGMLIGIVPNIPYEDEIIYLNEGELLVVFSDGISEAMNISEEEYSEERLEKMINIHRVESPDVFIKIIFDDVMKFSDSKSQMDDITMVVIKKG